MSTEYRKDDIALFMSNEPGVHLMEMFGHCEFNPDDIKSEEHLGRVKYVIGNGEAYLMTTLPAQNSAGGFICVADASDMIRKVDPEALTEEQKRGYLSRTSCYEAPNVYMNDPSSVRTEGRTVAEICEEVALKAVRVLFPESNAEGAQYQEDSWFRKENLLNGFTQTMELFSGHRSRKECESLAKQSDKLRQWCSSKRFKEFHMVNVGIEEPASEENYIIFRNVFEAIVKSIGKRGDNFQHNEQHIQTVNWIVAVDMNYEEVSIMRDITERSAFFMSLGPEFDQIREAQASFRDACIGRNSEH